VPKLVNYDTNEQPDGADQSHCVRHPSLVQHGGIGDAKQFRERANLPTDEPREQRKDQQKRDVELDGNPK
jgi:hypothetical protein